jgi:O-antigen/teichoic acid export membrane protein
MSLFTDAGYSREGAPAPAHEQPDASPPVTATDARVLGNGGPTRAGAVHGRLLRAGTWLTAAVVVSRLSSAIAVPLVARLLGPEALGVYTIGTSLTQSAQQLGSLGTEVAIHRNSARLATLGAKSIGALFGAGLLLVFTSNALIALGLFALRGPVAARWLGREDLSGYVAATAVVILLQPLGNLPLSFLAGLQDFRGYALRSGLGSTGVALLTVGLATVAGLPGAFAGLAAGTLLQAVWTWIIVRAVLRRTAIRLSLTGFIAQVRVILAFGFPYYLGSTLLPALVMPPILGLVSRSAGLDALGYLRVAQAVGSVIGTIPAAVAPAIISLLAATAANEHDYREIKSIHFRSMWALLLLPTALVAMVLPGFVEVIFGAAYTQAAALVWIALWVSALVGVGALLVQYLVADGRTRTTAWLSILGATLWAGAALVCVPLYGAFGFLGSQFVVQALIVAIAAPAGLRRLGTHDRPCLLWLLGLTVVLMVVTFFVPATLHDPVSMDFSALACTIVAGVLLYTKVLQRHERRLISARLGALIRSWRP